MALINLFSLSLDARVRVHHFIVHQFMDYAWLTVGSLFTVGVVEVESDIASMPVLVATRFSQPHSPGHLSLLIATLVIQPACEMAAAPEHAHIMTATAEPCHVSAAIPESSHC